MRSPLFRRVRAGLAVAVPFALAVAVGGEAAGPAQAVTPSYTITTGSTGSYAYADDTPAYPYVDSDGAFYFQSSHSLYGATQGRAWNFWTGTNIDTGVTKAAISSATDNADTTAQCNNSPTGQEATYLANSSSFAEKNYCDLIGVWVDPDTGDWYGVIHNEFTPSPFKDGVHFDSIDYALSTDKGDTWTIEDHILTSPFTTTRSTYQGWTMNSNGSLSIGTTCLDVYQSGTASGTAVDTYGCTGNANQKWTATNGTVVGTQSNLCLTASGNTAGSTFTIATCASGNALQKFTAPAAGVRGQVQLTGTGMCLDTNSTLRLAACADESTDGSNQFPNQTYYFGDGDPKLFVDYASGYFYLFYESQILNQGGSGRADFGHVARAPISAKMAPSSWKKYYDGTWTEPGEDGKEADIVPFDGTNTGYLDDAYDPSATGTVSQQLTAGTLPSAAPLAWMDVAWDAYLGMYISSARPENPTTSTPLHFYGTSDLATEKWTDLGTTTNPAGSAWYRSLLDSTTLTSAQLVGKTFRTYCMYSCGASTGTEWVATTIDTASANLPTPPVTAGTAYQIAAGDGRFLAQSGSALTTTASSSTAGSQGWKFTATGDGFFTIANAASGQTIGVDDTADAGRAWGASPTLGSGTGVGWQWSIQKTHDATLSGGEYRLVNRYSGLALSLSSGTGGVVTAPQRDWANTGSSGDTHTVNAQTLTFPAGGTTGPNLIPTGNFESGDLTGWTVHNATIVSDAAAHSPTHDLKLQSPAADYATMEYTVTGLSPNTTYTYSGWVRADSGSTVSFGVKNYGGSQITAHSTASSWTPQSDQFTTGATNTSATVFCYLPAASSTGTCDDLRLTAN